MCLADSRPRRKTELPGVPDPDAQRTQRSLGPNRGRDSCLRTPLGLRGGADGVRKRQMTSPGAPASVTTGLPAWAQAFIPPATLTASTPAPTRTSPPFRDRTPPSR